MAAGEDAARATAPHPDNRELTTIGEPNATESIRRSPRRGATSAAVVAAAAIAAVVAAIFALHPPATHAASAKGAVVSTAKTGLGRIIVNSNGRTLYLFENDRDGKSACSGQCAAFWPPLITSGKPRVTGGARASLCTTRRADGRLQVTYKHHPLYTFAKDKKKGQTNGEGLDAFETEWYVVSTAGSKIAKDANGATEAFAVLQPDPHHRNTNGAAATRRCGPTRIVAPASQGRNSVAVTFAVTRLAGVAERRGDPGDRAQERAASLGPLLLVRRAAVAARAARPGSRSSGRRTGCAAASSAGATGWRSSSSRASTICEHGLRRARVLGGDRPPEPRASSARARGTRAAISRLDFASVISRFSTSVRKNGHSR